MHRIAVAEAGLAGLHTVLALRAQGYGGELVLVGAEHHPPYDRPPLSKQVLCGDADDTTLKADWKALRQLRLPPARRPDGGGEGGGGIGRCGQGWHAVRVSERVGEVDAETDALVSDWMDVPAVADLLGVDVGKVRQLVRERQLLAVRRGEGRTLQVPADFLQEGRILKGLPGTLTVLADSGYDDVQSLRWLFTEDDSLPGRPVVALAENRGREVKRRAQALAF